MQTILTLDDLVIPKHDELLLDVLDHNHTHYTLYGGRGGVKSSFISIAVVLLLTQHKNIHAAVFRKVANTLRDSVYSQICFAVSLLGLEPLFKKTLSPIELTYLPTGQKIIFRGLDEPEKIKSIKAPFGCFGVTWFEEIDQMRSRSEIRKVLQSTMRGKDGSFWNFESFNPPISRASWVNKDLLINRRDRLCIESSYLDVPRAWLSEQFFEEAEFLKNANPKAYEHEYLGIPVGTGGSVFENLCIRTITDEEISSFDRCYYGLDWGWYPDPVHFCECCYDAARRRLFVFGEIRRNKTSNESLAELLRPWSAVRITADSAEPKSIGDFQSWGFFMRGAVKGPGSVEYSHKWLTSLAEIVVDPVRCPASAEEFLNYEYDRDKDGNIISGYPATDNHAIDAVRYALEPVWRRRGK